MRLASKPNHVPAISLPKLVTSVKNNSFPNVITTMKDLNQPNHFVELLSLNQIMCSISNNSNNILIGLNMIDINSNIFCLFSHTKKFLAF